MQQKGMKVESDHVVSRHLALRECNVLMIVVDDSRLLCHQKTRMLALSEIGKTCASSIHVRLAPSSDRIPVHTLVGVLR